MEKESWWKQLEAAFEKGGGYYSITVGARKAEAEKILQEFFRTNGSDRKVDPSVIRFLACLLFEKSAIRAGYLWGGLSLEEGPYHLDLIHRNCYLPVASCLNGDLICLSFNEEPASVYIVDCATLGAGERAERMEALRLSDLRFLVESIRTNNPLLPIDKDFLPWSYCRQNSAAAYNWIKGCLRPLRPRQPSKSEI